MKKHIPGVIVVEGKMDEVVIKSLFDAVIVKTNGYDINNDDIEFVKQIPNRILLTDSDEAGITIRNRLNDLCDFINVTVDITKCNKKNKHGVAEADRDYLYNLLLPYVSNINDMGTLKLEDLYKLSLTGKDDSKLRREYISSRYHLGVTNSKTVLERLNLLKISYNELEESLKEYGNK